MSCGTPTKRRLLLFPGGAEYGQSSDKRNALCPPDQFRDSRQCLGIPHRTAPFRAERGQRTPCYGFRNRIQNISRLTQIIRLMFQPEPYPPLSRSHILLPNVDSTLPTCPMTEHVGSFLFLSANDFGKHIHIIIRCKAVLFFVSA